MPINKTSSIYSWSLVGLSLCVICLPVYLILFGKKETSPLYLKTIVQKTTTIESLSPRFFSDYLGLSPKGRSLHIQNLDIRKIQKKLSEFPIFEKVQSEFTPQGELLVSYELRRPLFSLLDFSNCGLDSLGFFIPMAPYYSPKKLASIFLGIKNLEWNKAYDIKEAVEILNFFSPYLSEDFNIKLIDLSHLKESIPARREIIVTIAFAKASHFLRLNPKHLHKALDRYMLLFKEPTLQEQIIRDVIFDARISRFATLKKLENNL